MSRYFLSTHSFACETGKHAVFLNLKRGKYSAVSSESVATLRDVVEGWPVTRFNELTGADKGPAGGPDDDDRKVIDTLIREGVLTTDASAGKQATPVCIEAPTVSFVAAPRVWPHLTAQHVRNFVASWALTTAMLRTMPTGWMAKRARRRKEREAPRAPAFDMPAARRLTAIHFALQPVFYPSKEACLRDSFTLLEYLARYRIYPTCVFGVKMDPFAAHCWVQHGPIVLTDLVENLRGYTPIMSI